MADNKQYITTNQENGAIMISEDVIATIVSQAIKDIEGVVSLNVKPGAELADMIGKKAWAKGLKIVIVEDNSVTIDCNIVIGYGQSVVAIAANVQENVTAALESMAGVTVKGVNISVVGIIRK